MENTAIALFTHYMPVRLNKLYWHYRHVMRAMGMDTALSTHGIPKFLSRIIGLNCVRNVDYSYSPLHALRAYGSIQIIK